MLFWTCSQKSRSKQKRTPLYAFRDAAWRSGAACPSAITWKVKDGTDRDFVPDRIFYGEASVRCRVSFCFQGRKNP